MHLTLPQMAFSVHWITNCLNFGDQLISLDYLRQITILTITAATFFQEHMNMLTLDQRVIFKVIQQMADIDLNLYSLMLLVEQARLSSSMCYYLMFAKLDKSPLPQLLLELQQHF